MKIRALFTVLLLLSFLSFATSPALAGREGRTGSLGAGGEVYLAKVGQESELFGAKGAGSDALVLGLEILRPNQEPEWIKVPESEGVNPNASYFVLYEDSSNTVYVVWEGRIGSHPIIQLAAFQDGSWSGTHLVSDNIWSLKGFPQLAISRESFEIEDQAGEIRTAQRTLLHVVWWEQTAEGDRTLYRPLLLEDGKLQTMGQVSVLNELASDAIALDAEDPYDDLVRHPSVQVGADGRTTLITFADQVTRRILVLEVNLLPAGLGLLADDVHDFVLGLGPLDPQDPEISSIAGRIHSRIVIVGHRVRLNPQGVQHLAQEVHALVSESVSQEPPPDLASLAGTIHSRIVIVGARISGETLDQFRPALATSVIEVAPDTAQAIEPAGGDPEVPTLVRLTLASELPIPVAGPGRTHLFASPEGSDLVLAWETEDGLQFRKASGGSWSTVNHISTLAEIDLPTALKLLEQSVQPGL